MTEWSLFVSLGVPVLTCAATVVWHLAHSARLRMDFDAHVARARMDHDALIGVVRALEVRMTAERFEDNRATSKEIMTALQTLARIEGSVSHMTRGSLHD